METKWIREVPAETTPGSTLQGADVDDFDIDARDPGRLPRRLADEAHELVSTTVRGRTVLVIVEPDRTWEDADARS
jgi:hypothetical protein